MKSEPSRSSFSFLFSRYLFFKSETLEDSSKTFRAFDYVHAVDSTTVAMFSTREADSQISKLSAH